jgi:hypothetical protein
MTESTRNQRLTSTGPRKVVWRLTPFGAFGAVLPAVSALGLHSDAFSFAPELRIVMGQIVYVAAAALLSGIFPYGRRATPFAATLVGICFPTIVGSALGIAKLAIPTLAAARGEGVEHSIVGWMVDTFALF